MPYLLSKNNTNVLVDKTGENIYYRNYPSMYNSRAIVVAKTSSNEYTAQIDSDNNMHIIYKSSNNSIIHLYESNGKFDKKIVLDDFNNIYKISNLKYICDEKNYLFYCAVNPYEKTSDLIFHSFSKTEDIEPQSLLTLPNLNSPYECILHNRMIYLLCSVQNENKYELNLYRYNIAEDTWYDYETIVTLTNPINDYSLCIYNDEIRVAYVVEQFGYNKLLYTSKSDHWSEPIEIYSCGQKLSPIIFTYNNIIWINWKEQNLLKASLSSNNGKFFTEAQKCSAQSSESTHYYFYGCKNKNLWGNKFYGYINKHPILAILSQVDTDNILLYNHNNLEMKSIINAFTTNNNSVDKKEIKKELDYQLQVQEQITTQYNELAELAKELQNEGKKWKSKYFKAENEIKKLKKKLRRTVNTLPDTNNE